VLPSGLMEGACECIDQRFADAKRSQELEGISSGWSGGVKEAFKALEKPRQNSRTCAPPKKST
jgi:hypothetical protein